MTSSFGIPDSASGPRMASLGSPGMAGQGQKRVIVRPPLSVMRKRWGRRGEVSPIDPDFSIGPSAVDRPSLERVRARRGHPAPGPGYQELRKELNGQRKGGTAQVPCSDRWARCPGELSPAMSGMRQPHASSPSLSLARGTVESLRLTVISPGAALSPCFLCWHGAVELVGWGIVPAGAWASGSAGQVSRWLAPLARGSARELELEVVRDQTLPSSETLRPQGTQLFGDFFSLVLGSQGPQTGHQMSLFIYFG